jgi:hypothetical protein
MTLTELVEEDLGGRSPVLAGPSPGPGRGRPRALILAVVVVSAALVVLVVFWIQAAVYQPLGFGGSQGGDFPGLPKNPARLVDNSGGEPGEYYVAPQLGPFTIVASVQNFGPTAVTIEAVTTRPPAAMGSWPVVEVARALALPEYHGPGQPVWTTGRPVRGLSLGPNQAIIVGVPVKMAGRCYVPNSTASLGTLFVEERYLEFTHWVTIPLDTPVVMREPEPAGPGNVCLK